MDRVERQAEATPAPRNASATEIVNAGAPEPAPETADAQGELAMVVVPVAARPISEVAPARPALEFGAAPEPVSEPDELALDPQRDRPKPAPEHLPVAAEPVAPAPANDVAPPAEPESTPHRRSGRCWSARRKSRWR